MTRLLLTEAVALLRDARRDDDIVIPSMSNAREWMALGPLHARDFVLVPSAMGHATSMGLGLALAQPQRRVIVLSGDGSLLMNLGSLVTIGAEAPPNLVVIVFDNGVYEVTGSQPVPGANAVDFAAIARGCGINSFYQLSTLDEMKRELSGALDARGPTVIVLKVEPTTKPGPRSPGPTVERVARFRRALNGDADSAQNVMG